MRSELREVRFTASAVAVTPERSGDVCVGLLGPPAIRQTWSHSVSLRSKPERTDLKLFRPTVLTRRQPVRRGPTSGGYLLALLFAPALPAQTPDLTQPESLIHQNNLPAAEQLLRATLAANPNSPDTLYLLAAVLNRENKPKDSLVLYTQAAALRRPTSDDLRIVALDYVLLNDYTDAAHWLTRSLDADPRNAEAWYSLGRVHMEQGDFIEAERNFRRTLALTPSDPRALDNLGLSLEAQNRSDEALAAYQGAIAAQSHRQHPSEQPLLNLGTLLNSRSRSPEAIGFLRTAVGYAPGSARCHEELARSYAATGQDALAIAELQQAVALDPANPRLHFQLGQIFRRTGMSAKADAELRTSASLYGSHSTPVDR